MADEIKWSGSMGFGDSADTSSITAPPPTPPQGWGDLLSDTYKLGKGATESAIGAGERFAAPYTSDPNAWRQSGSGWVDAGQKESQSLSPAGQQTTDAPFFSGETLQHPINKLTMGIGKQGPWLLPALIPGGGVAGMAGRAALGGALGYTGAYSGLIDTINAQPDDQLQKNSPTYAEIRKTQPEYDAKQMLADQAWGNIPTWEKGAILGTSAVAGEAGPLATVGKTVAGSVGRTLTARYAEGKLAKAGLNAVETGGVMGAQYAGTAIPTRDALGSVGVQGDTNADIIKGTIENTAMGAVIGGGTRYVRPHGGKNESRSDTRGDAAAASGARVGEVPAGQADPAQAAALQSTAQPVTGYEDTYHGPATGYEMQYPPEPPRSMPQLYKPPPPTGYEQQYAQPIPPRPTEPPTGYEGQYTPPEQVQNIKPPFTVPPPGTQRPLGINVPDQPERPGARGPQGELPLRPPQAEPVQGELPLEQPSRGVTQLGLPGMGADVTHEAAPATTISAERPLDPIKSEYGLGPYGMPKMRQWIDTSKPGEGGGEPPDDTSGGTSATEPPPTKPKPSGGGAATVRSKMAKPPATKDSDTAGAPLQGAARLESMKPAAKTAKAAEPTSKAKGSPAQAAWYLLSDPQRGALQEHLTGVLEKKGSLSWEDIPKGYTAKFGVSEATSIKQGFKDDPHEAIATLDPDYGRKGKAEPATKGTATSKFDETPPAAKGDDTLAARAIMEQRERAARRKSNAEVKARGAPTLPGEGQPTAAKPKFDESKLGTGEAVLEGKARIDALKAGAKPATEATTKRATTSKFDETKVGTGEAVLEGKARIDALKAGAKPAAETKAEAPAQMPFMITQLMKAQLRALGYKSEAISNMTPADAHTILQGETPPKPVQTERPTVPSKGEVPVTKLEPTDARLSGVVSDKAAKEAARKAAAEGVATVRRKQKEAADKLAAEQKTKTPLVKTNSMRALLEELGYSHDDFKRMKLADVQRIIQTGERKPGAIETKEETAKRDKEQRDWENEVLRKEAELKAKEAEPISDEDAPQDTEPRAKGGGTSDVLQRIHDLPDEKEGSESVNQNPTEEGSIEAAKADVDQNATPAQLAAGNFKQGHVTVDGQQVTIHSAIGEEGQAEGHILGTADNVPGEHLETIIDKDQLPNKTHVVNKIDKDTGEFAGHVAVLGAETADHALHSYQTILEHKYGTEVEGRLADLSAGVVEMTPEQFDNWQGTRNPNEPVHPTDTGKHPFNEVESFGKKIKGRDVQGSSTLHTALEEALRRIPDTKQYIIYRQLARMIMKYLPDVPIYYIKSEAYDKVRPGTNAVYNATMNHILISSKLDPTTTPEVTLLHEGMHAVTMHLYLNNKAFRGLVDTILTEYKQGMPGINDRMSHNVKLGGGKELLAELADPKVINQLGRIQMSETLAKRLDMDTWAKNTQTLWNGLVAAFKRTLEGMGFAVPGRDAASRFNLLEGMLRMSDDAFMARSKHARTDFGNMIRAAEQHGADSATTIDSEHNSQQNIYNTIHDAVSNPEGLRRAYQSGADSITSKASDLVDRLPRGTFKRNAAEYVWPFIGGDALRMNHEGNFGEKTEANPYRRASETGLRRDSYLSKLVNKTNDIIHDMFKETRDHTREQVEHLSDTLSNATAFRADPRYKVGEGANEWMTKPGWQWRNEAKQAIANHTRITKMYNDIAPGLKPRFTKLIDEYSRAGAEQAELGAKELIDSITNAGQKFLPELKVIDTKDVKMKSRQEYIKFHNDWEKNWDKNKEVLRKHLLNNELTDDEERWLAERGFKDISDIRDLATPRGPFVPLDHAGEFILDGRMKIEAPANGKLVDGTDNVFRFKTEAEAEAFLNKQPPRSSMSTVHFNDEGKQVPKWDTWQNPDGSVGFAKNNKAWHVEVNDKYYSGHDSISAANKRYDALKASGKFAKLSPPMSKRSGWYSGLQISSPLFKHLISEVEKRTDYTDGQKKAVIQLLKDSALSSMEGNRIAKHMLPRKAVAGWDTDYIKTYKSYFDAHNALMSRAKYAKDINDATNEMIKYADDHQFDSGSGPTNRSLVLNELNKRDNFFGTANDTGSEGPNKTVGRVMKYAEAASYFANMISPGHVIVHQTHQILTADMLAAKYGPLKTMARASKMHSTLAGTGFKNVLSSVKEIYNVITKDSRGLNYIEGLMDKVSQDPKYGAEIRAMLEEAIATNRLHPDQGFDASVLHMGSGRFDRGLARLDLASRQTMGATEAYSRVWGYSLGYTLARDAGETHEQAMRTAFDSVSRTQGMLSRSNMSRVMNKWYMRAPMQFRAWGVNMMVTLAKSIHDIFKPDAPGVRAEAVRRLLYLFGTTMALTGINGLPSDAMRVGLALTNALNLTDYDWADAQNSMREYFAEKTSPGVANFLMDGALASLGPFSFFGADRVGFGSLAVFGEPDDHTKGSFAKWILGIMGGAPFEKVWDIGTGIKALKEGDYAKATESLVPLKIIDDWAKAWQGAYQGFPTKTGAPGMEPYSMGETFMQSLGLTPDRKERWREASNTEYRAETATKDEKSQLLNGLGTATTEPDRMKARMQIAAYNLRNPNSRIGSQDIMKALRRQTAPAGLGRTLYRGNRERIRSLEEYYEAY